MEEAGQYSNNIVTKMAITSLTILKRSRHNTAVNASRVWANYSRFHLSNAAGVYESEMVNDAIPNSNEASCQIMRWVQLCQIIR